MIQQPFCDVVSWRLLAVEPVRTVRLFFNHHYYFENTKYLFYSLDVSRRSEVRGEPGMACRKVQGVLLETQPCSTSVESRWLTEPHTCFQEPQMFSFIPSVTDFVGFCMETIASLGLSRSASLCVNHTAFVVMKNELLIHCRFLVLAYFIGIHWILLWADV